MIKEYTKKDGSKAYMFVAYLGIDPITGKQKRTTRRGFKTKREAKIAEAKLQAEIEENGFYEVKDLTFQEVYELWWEQYKNTVRESTQKVVQAIFNRGILPAFGKQKIKEISIVQCQKQLNMWYGKYVEYRKYKGYTTQVFDYAISLQLIRENPFKHIRTPRSKSKDTVEELLYYSKEELKQFLSFIEGDIMYYAIFRILAFTGLRKGELMALQWADINFDINTLTVTKTVAEGMQGLIIQPPKTKSSNRSVSFDESTAKALRRWRSFQRTLLLKYGFNSNNDKQLVFSNPTTNKILSKMTITHKLWRICDEHNFKKIKLHGFRHTHCTLLFESGASLKSVQERLGHSNIQTTMDIYNHVTQKQRDESAEKLFSYVNF